ncbi:MAG: GntR family transcriptional regulator [Lachnospiraceae bacterium]|jgi:GntR family transcriptional regulator|nr:GntR family transcriptional regulator [Lachnospiraceae bacterium]
MSLFDHKIDKASPVPLYYQLKEFLLAEIKDGGYQVEGAIPTEKEIGEAFDISRTTVRQAITEMVQEGWLYRVKSKGTFVKRRKINQDFIQRLESFDEQILRSGMRPSTKLLAFQLLEAPLPAAEQLQLKTDSRVFFLHRIRFADDLPVVVLKTYVPYGACPELGRYDFEKESLYGVLSKRRESRVHHVTRLVEAVEADAADEDYLHIEKGKPIQHFTSVGYTEQGVPVEYSLARYRGDRSSFQVTVYTKE